MEICSSDIKVGTKIKFVYKRDDNYAEGVVTHILPYDKEVGMPHYYVDGYYGYAISLSCVLRIIDIPANAES